MNNYLIDLDKSKGRLEALSDGIFAITMTMMIIDLKIPDNSYHNLSPEELNNSLLTLLPAIKSYFLSFFILGIFWLRQQIQLSMVSIESKYSIIFYIFFLLLIGFVPFTVNLIKRYPDYHTPFILYSLNLLMISLILFFNVFLAYRKENFKKNTSLPDKGKKFLTYTGFTVIIFLTGFIISFFDVEIAFYAIIVDPVYFFVYRRFRKAGD
ncbi:MAG TPA: TMEM175 family protein [Ignavibacteria bacterium]|nr:TMEM175 family protein [Ignavibacteria bacterium]HMR40726.1 TMEM175 family protein [Ignavibacteria bacterium]